MLSLKNDAQLIEEYVEMHKFVPVQVQEGIREVGIIDMQIYRQENTLFMIVDTTDDFDWVKDNERLSNLPGQKEWEREMDKYQDVAENRTSAEKWRLMEKIFELGKQ